MTYRRFSYALHALLSIAALVVAAVHFTATLAARSIMYLVRDAPIDVRIAILPRSKAVYFAIIGLLKPVYRESLQTNGQSLDVLKAA